MLHSCHKHYIPIYVRALFLNLSISLIGACSVVKSRLQAGSADALRYKSSFDGLLTILKEEGIEGLYKGIGSKIVQSVLTAAILFAGQRRIFEITKQACHFLLLFFAFLTRTGRLCNRSSEPRDT